MNTTTLTRKRAKPGHDPLTPAVLKLWREQMGYTQKIAAERLGCDRMAFAGWENGLHRIPVYIGLAMNALALNMPPYGTEADDEEGDR